MKTKKSMKLSRETLQQLSHGQLPRVAAMTGPRSECVTYFETYCPTVCTN